MIYGGGRMRSARFRAAVACLLPAVVQARAAGRKAVEPLPLVDEHRTADGLVSFRSPAGWVSRPTGPETTEAWGEGPLGLRLVTREGEVGLDSLHATCMLERLAGPMDTDPWTRYEYDFVGGIVADRRALDSAFAVRYDAAILGHREWRQRNLTVVGAGRSVCVVAYAPAALWKKSKAARATLEAVLASIVLR
jgi:hypothetical protein